MLHMYIFLQTHLDGTTLLLHPLSNNANKVQAVCALQHTHMSDGFEIRAAAKRTTKALQKYVEHICWPARNVCHTPPSWLCAIFLPYFIHTHIQ